MLNVKQAYQELSAQAGKGVLLDCWENWECPVARLLEGMELVKSGDSPVSAPVATTKLELEGL